MKPTKQGVNRNLMISIIIFSSFIFLILILIFTYHLSTEESVMSPILSPFIKYHVYFMIIVSSFGIAVGASVFYFMSKKLEDKETDAKKNTEILLKFLNKDEREIIKKIVESNGKILQSQLSRTTSLNKVKVHRILSKLKEKELIKIQNHGKTNIILMPDEIYSSLV
ncbi:TPA: hypothetical protein HA235_03875 [Candidatus Woesearchaeota archaeon]|nr:hypothetical protein [uncultured archaeon]MBS3173315.1 hypothetical protein [Candidatus Woesearchaeota archaeon]HIH31821.1 hypothetical protein [Candidatus Woesearchaeota archaeon]HIH55464.1 hypothetical protein [Candidatus Woesearchaeota archaeon]HIJ01894.1 hypothetical protein [Candidatus Woesearchaeota archaeon]